MFRCHMHLLAELGAAIPKTESLTFSSCGASCGVGRYACVNFSAICNSTERRSKLID